MPEDRVTITADARQYFDVLSRAGVAADRLSGSGARVGEGFVRGERVIRTATQNIAASLLTASDATSTFLVAASALERVFKVGIGPTIAVAAAIKGFEILHEQVKKTNDAYKDLKDELSKPLIPDAVTAEADRKIEELTQKIERLRKESESPVSKTSGIFAGLAGIAANALLPSFLSRPAASALGALAPVGLSKVQEVTNAAGQRLEAFAAKRGQDILAAADKLKDALREAVARFRSSTGNLFRDIGSGQFARDLEQRNLENLQTRHGQDLAALVEEKVRLGLPLNELEAAIGNAARAAARRGGVGIQDILSADFSNLDVLSKYDFSGLAPLSGISIIIQ